jgi:hypothetical protein
VSCAAENGRAASLLLQRVSKEASGDSISNAQGGGVVVRLGQNSFDYDGPEIDGSGKAYVIDYK